MMCVDSSLVAKWIFPEEHSDKALSLLDDALANAERMIAPPLVTIEVTNIIRQRMRTAGLSLDEAVVLLELFLSFPITLLSPDDLPERALRLAHQYHLPAIHDAQYVALAERSGCDLWTDDRRLLRDLNSRLTFVHWIGDYVGVQA